MKPVRLILLAGIVAALVLVTVFKPGIEPEPEPGPITDIDPDTISRIIIKRAQETIHLQKKDHAWRIIEPLSAAADGARVRSLLEMAQATSLADYPVDDTGLTQFGLDQPGATVLMLDDNALIYGRTDPLGHRRYVRVADTLHLVAGTGFYHLMSSVGDLVDPALLAQGSKLIRLSLPGVELHRDDQGIWTAEGDSSPPGPDAIQALVDAWVIARALQVTTDSATPGETQRIEIEHEGSEPVRFDVSETGAGYIFRRQDNGLDYHLSKAFAESLLQPARPDSPE